MEHFSLQCFERDMFILLIILGLPFWFWAPRRPWACNTYPQLSLNQRLQQLENGIYGIKAPPFKGTFHFPIYRWQNLRGEILQKIGLSLYKWFLFFFFFLSFPTSFQPLCLFALLHIYDTQFQRDHYLLRIKQAMSVIFCIVFIWGPQIEV